MRIVVVGVGALGSLFGGALSANGHDVSLLIRNNAHRAAIRANGLQMYLDSGDLVVHPKIIDAESLNSESGDSGSSGEMSLRNCMKRGQWHRHHKLYQPSCCDALIVLGLVACHSLDQ